MRRVLSIVICICMIFSVQMPTGFAEVNPAESDILFEDDFEGYAEDATSVDKSVKGWTAVSGNLNQKLVTEENGNHYIRFNSTVADTEAGIGEQQYPAINKVVAASAGDTIAIAASVMVTKSEKNSGISYLQLRETTGSTRRVTINKFTANSIEFCEESTGYKAVSGKWVNYEVYVKIAAAGSNSDIVMKMYGDGVVDASGNTVSEDNPVIIRKQISLDTMSIDANSNVRVLFNNNIGINSITNDSEENHAYVGLDNVVVFNADTAFDGSTLSDLKVNGASLSGFDGETVEYDVKIAHDAEEAVIEAYAAEGSEIVISDNNITEFPKTVTVTVTNAIGLSSTYTLNLTKKRSATEVEAYLEKAYGGADSIISMTYDDGIYDTAVFINEQFKKYDLRGSIMAITSKIETEELRTKWLELLDDGYLDMQSHSSTHLVLPSDSWAESANRPGTLENNTPENYQSELVDSKASLEEWVLNDVVGFAASNNTLSDGAWEVVRDTYYAARLGSRGYNTLDPEEGVAAGSWHNLKMQGFYDVEDTSASTKAEKIAAFADNAVENEAWLVTMCHSIQENAGDATMAEAEYAFRRIAQYVNENKLWCTTFGDAIKYVRERQNSVAYADLIDNQVIVEVVTDNTNIPADIFNHPLTVKTSVPAEWSMVSYSVGDETETAKVFEENGSTWAYVNVLPNTKATVISAGTSNKLSGIAVNGIKIEGFDSDTYEYNLSYLKDELPLAITAQTKSTDAVIAISDESVDTFPATVTLTVTDGNGEEQVYTLNITRTPSDDATLSSLKVNGAQVEGFAADTYSYAVEVDAVSAAVTAEATDENASVTIDKDKTDEFPATVNVTVTAENGDKKVYSVVISQIGGDEIILDDDFTGKTVGYKMGNKSASSTVFDTGSSALGTSGVKAVKDEEDDNIYGQFYYDVDEGTQYTSLAAYTKAGLTGTVVVKGKMMIPAGTSSRHDVHIRTNKYNEETGKYASNTTVIKLLEFSGSSILLGGSTEIGKFTKGNWVEYTIAFEEDMENSIYKTQVWVEGEGLFDTESNAISEPIYGSGDISYTFQSLANTDSASQRIVYRGVTPAGKTVNLDDTKIYKQGNFHIKSASESVELNKGEKLNIKVNHDMATQALDADSITVTTADGTSAKIASVEKVSTTELNVVFDKSTPEGEYTVSFGDSFKNIIGKKTDDTVKVKIINPKASVSVASLNGNITADIGGITYDWKNLHTESFSVGENITLTAVANGNNKFMYWIDTVSERIVSEEEGYSFILGSNTNLKAVFTSEASYFVTFVSANGKVLTVSDTGEASVPSDPYIGGYKFYGWYLEGEKQNLTAGDDVKAVDKDLYYIAGFKKEMVSYTVTLINANEEGGSYRYNDNVTVTAKDRSSEGLVFVHWKKNNVVVSYDSAYSFYVSGDETLEACYAQTAEEKKVIISLISRQIDESRMGFFSEYNISDEYTVIETGILMGENAGLTLESAPIKATAVSKNNKGQFTVRKAGLNAGDVYYGRGYLIYTDGSEIYTIYSDELAAEMK